MSVDADLVEKLRWKAALREVLRKLPQMSAEDVQEKQLEPPWNDTPRSNDAAQEAPNRLHRANSEGDLDDLKGWAADLYQRR